MKVRVLLAAAMVLGASSAFAAGDAGCGLGGMLLKDNTKLMQILAATTNGFSGSQTFGITTGTSECTAQNFVMSDKAIQYFAEVNQNELSKEMAQGQGEKLSTLASLYGCKGESVKSFSEMTQGSYSKIVPAADTTTAQLVKNLNNEFFANKTLVNSCQSI